MAIRLSNALNVSDPNHYPIDSHDTQSRTRLVRPTVWYPQAQLKLLLNARSRRQFDVAFDRLPSTTKERRILCAGWWARNQMIANNMLLVAKVATAQFESKKSKMSSLTVEDLIDQGTFGIGDAIAKFDRTRGNEFSTHAYWWIMQAISRHVNRCDRAVRLPSHQIELASKINKAQVKLTRQLGRSPTAAEIAEAIPCPRATAMVVREVQGLIRSELSLDRPLQGDAEETHLEFLVSPATEYPDSVEELESIIRVANLSRAQEIVIRESLAEDGASTQRLHQQLGLSRQRYSQIRIAAVDRLRRAAFAINQCSDAS